VGAQTVTTVNAWFRRVYIRTGATHSVDCNSRGTIELSIQNAIEERAARPSAAPGMTVER
jgi:hypothetical protein